VAGRVDGDNTIRIMQQRIVLTENFKPQIFPGGKPGAAVSENIPLLLEAMRIVCSWPCPTSRYNARRRDMPAALQISRHLICVPEIIAATE
jgi:hypothetical protein